MDLVEFGQAGSDFSRTWLDLVRFCQILSLSDSVGFARVASGRGPFNKSRSHAFYIFHTSPQITLEKQREQVELEKVEWQEKFMKKQETHLLQKERELKEGVRDDRDKEIEMVIQRLEKEASESREEVEKTADNRIK